VFAQIHKARTRMAEDFILETRELTREFKGFVAVDHVNLQIRRGSIHALIGPNGAGKTTVFNLLTKFLPVSSGQIFYNGQDITQLRAADVALMGMVRSFQISAVFPHLSVLENVRVGLQRKLGTSFHFWKSEQSLNVLNDQAMQLLEEVDLAQFADTETVSLPYGRKRALEIATTRDVLSANLPILTKPGHTMMSRLTAHMVSAVGLSELVVHDAQTYKAKAIQIGNDRALLARLKQQLIDGKRDSALFDTHGFAQRFGEAVQRGVTHMQADSSSHG
jgi:branched-chain amino acid transport system ATP-binding protein